MFFYKNVNKEEKRNRITNFDEKPAGKFNNLVILFYGKYAILDCVNEESDKFMK